MKPVACSLNKFVNIINLIGKIHQLRCRDINIGTSETRQILKKR